MRFGDFDLPHVAQCVNLRFADLLRNQLCIRKDPMKRDVDDPKRSFRHCLTTLVMAFFIAFATVGVTQVAEPTVAEAAPKGFFAKNCIIRAISGPGFKGNGCNLYSATYYVKGNRFPKGPPNKYMVACGQGILVSSVVGVFLGPAGFLGAVFLGCAENMAQAAIFGQ